MSGPVDKRNLGNVEVSIWKNEQYGTYSFKFQKSYKGKDGSWKNSDFFGLTDLANVIGLSMWAQVQMLNAKKPKSKPGNGTMYQEPEPPADGPDKEILF